MAISKDDGVWISADVCMDSNLTKVEKIYYSKIKMLQGDSGCFATNKYFMELFGNTKRGVNTTISNLVKKGYVKVSYEFVGDTKSVKHRILRTPCKSLHQGSAKNNMGVVQKFAPINKEVNKDIKKEHLSVFNEWYDLYGRKKEPKQAIAQWLKISPELYPKIIAHTRLLVENVIPRYRKYPHRYLRDESFYDEVDIKETSKEELDKELIARNEKAIRDKQIKEKQEIIRIEKQLKAEKFDIKEELLKHNPKYQKHTKFKKKVKVA